MPRWCRSSCAKKARALSFLVESELGSSFLFEHDLFRKPVPTFRDHALGGGGFDAKGQSLYSAHARESGHPVFFLFLALGPRFRGDERNVVGACDWPVF